MKVYLHGPRQGQTVKLQGVQFVNGEAEVMTLSNVLRRFYNVQESNPNQEEVPVEVVEEVQDVDPETILNAVVQAKKEELTQAEREVYGTPISEINSMSWFKFKAFVKQHTGKDAKNKATGWALLGVEP